MRRVLLVAEGTLDHPVANVMSIFAGMSVTLVCGFLIITIGMPGPVTIAAVAALLIAVAWLKARFGGQRTLRVEKPAGDEPLRVAGRFEEGQVGTARPRDLVATELCGDRLYFEVSTDEGTERFHIRPPAFSRDSLVVLRDAISDLRTLSVQDIPARFSQQDLAIRVHDAKTLILLRYYQKPSYIMIIWLVAALTVLFWLILSSALFA